MSTAQAEPNHNHDHNHNHNNHTNNTYLLLQNPKPTSNQGPLLRCASAFAISNVILIGHRKCSVEGAHGSDRHLNITSQTTFDHALKFIYESQGENLESFDVEVVGILGCVFTSLTSFNEMETEIMVPMEWNGDEVVGHVRSFPVHKYNRPFCNSADKRLVTVFILLNDLISDENKRLATKVCNLLVHVPQFIPANSVKRNAFMSLIDAPSRLSIVLHHYNAQRKLKERARGVNDSEVHKFEVDNIASKVVNRKKSDEMKKVAQRDAFRKENEDNADAVFDIDNTDYDTDGNMHSWGNLLFGI